MYQFTPRVTFTDILHQNKPKAVAWVTGNSSNPQLSGLVKFYSTPYDGVLIEAEIFGLPNVSTENSSNFYAMHIHQFGDCSNNFANTGEHYNPTNEPHPDHEGDLLPLLGNQGYAWYSFYDKRFTIDSIIGRSVVIHARRDDFTTQPAGDSGEKIGCGVIRAEYRH
ncbi:superoxide dismutase family protein [Kineothrix sp. MB12-C1]|nr:superoxide dismutase family protein [Kineothrix sp. MB12-C1]WMC94480.1 superoxide dismutase family protein [Kineothrix sp. MB12-C1]